MDRARILLKQKYELVHVPREEKARAWQREALDRLRGGESAEEAGRRAAAALFPYEFRGRSRPEITVEAILERFPL